MAGAIEDSQREPTHDWHRERDSFGEDYGTTIVDGPMAGLLARAVVVIGADGKVTYVQLVPEIAQEPDYDAALAALG